MHDKILLAAFASIALAFAAPAAAQQAPSSVQPSPVKRTPIGKVEVPGTNQEVLTAVVEIAAGFKAGRHTHPGTVQVYMLEGEFWLALDGQPEKTYSAGQSFEVPNGAIHNEGAIGDKPVKFVGVYVVEKGKPLVQPVQ
jgi:quercetin dioxygenase-like cupin family protein